VVKTFLFQLELKSLYSTIICLTWLIKGEDHLATTQCGLQGLGNQTTKQTTKQSISFASFSSGFQ